VGAADADFASQFVDAEVLGEAPLDQFIGAPDDASVLPSGVVGFPSFHLDGKLVTRNDVTFSAEINDQPIKYKVLGAGEEDDQLSKAIGRRGQNVRLAAKLTNVRIDITSTEDNEDGSGHSSKN